MQALRGTAVPVPKALLLCEDSSVIGTPFFIMEYIEGRVFDDPSLPQLQPHERRAAYASAVQALVKLHQVCMCKRLCKYKRAIECGCVCVCV